MSVENAKKSEGRGDNHSGQRKSTVKGPGKAREGQEYRGNGNCGSFCTVEIMKVQITRGCGKGTNLHLQIKPQILFMQLDRESQEEGGPTINKKNEREIGRNLRKGPI